MVSEADIKPLHECFVELRRAVKNKFAHQDWGSDVILAQMFTLTELLYTLTNRKPSRGVGNMRAWDDTSTA